MYFLCNYKLRLLDAKCNASRLKDILTRNCEQNQVRHLKKGEIFVKLVITVVTFILIDK